MTQIKNKIGADGGLLTPFITYTGAFLFAIIMIITIHESGHYLAFLWRGYDSVQVMINPFMGATSSVEEIRQEDAVIIILAGTVVNLSVASLLTLLLRNRTSSYWIPLKMIPATAFLIEGMVIVAGFFIQERVTDFSMLISLGWSPVLVGLLGVLILILGGYLTYEVWRAVGIQPGSSRLELFLFNGGFFLYTLAGVLLSEYMLPPEMVLIRRFLRVNFSLHWIYLGIRVFLAPVFLKIMQRGIQVHRIQLSKRAGIFSIVFGLSAWLSSFLLFN